MNPVPARSARKITNAHRSVIMQAAHRTRRALGLGMGEALKAAWRQFRQAQTWGWPVDTKLTMPHERIATPAPNPNAKRLFTRASGRLAASFAA